MPATALRVDEPIFRDSIAKYVLATCQRWHVRRADVDDVVQEAWATILARRASFCPERGEFEAWARGVALNVIRQHARDAKRYDARFSDDHQNIDEHAAPEPSPERHAQRAEARSSIVEASDCLTEQQAQIVVLHIVDELSHVDISDELGISESASQKCYQRARNHLARCLEGKLLSAMPPNLTSCDEPISTLENTSPWFERSHYFTQLAVAFAAVLLLFSLRSTSTMHAPKSEARADDFAINHAMYRSDKRTDVRDEPAVLQDIPSGKPEAASLPSVPAVSTPTRVGDKPTYVEPSPLPPYKHSPRTLDHRRIGR